MIYKNKIIETIRYKVDAVSVSPVSVKDSEDSLKVDDITGKFYIPGSSVAGAFRNYYENYFINESGNISNVLFGSQNTGMNRVVCFDAFTFDDSERQMLSSRPGLRIDRKRLTQAYSFSMSQKRGSKFKRQFVNDGVRFLFIFELNDYDDECDFKCVQEQFEKLLAAFAAGDILLGNSKTVGFGRFKINSVHKTAYNLRDYNDVIKYLLKEEKDEDITESIISRQNASKNIHFRIKARTVTPLLIKDEVVRSHDEPDGINIKNGSNQYVIPGSSLKGALRSRAEKLANTFPCITNDLISNIFGVESDKDDAAHISRLVCYDTVIRNSKKGIYNKIKIDYFTGGVQQHVLVTDETVMGDLEIECVFNTFGLESYDKEIGLLLLVLRDLCTENLNIGGGYAVGRGYIRASTLEMNGRQKIIYDFDSPDKSAEEQFNSYISRLMVG